MRKVILGGPKTGKTTKAKLESRASGVPLLMSDDFIDLGWSESSEHVAQWMHDNDGPWIAEGVALARALRKHLRNWPDDKPCDMVLFLETPHEEQSKGQAAMDKGLRKVFAEIRPKLERLGVEVVVER